MLRQARRGDDAPYRGTAWWDQMVPLVGFSHSKLDAYKPFNMFECFVPLPVPQNQAVGLTVKAGRAVMYNTPESNAWASYVHNLLYDAKKVYGMQRVYRSSPKRCAVIVYMHVQGLYDSDAGLKKLFDVLEGHAYAKDDQVDGHTVFRQPWREDSVEHMHVCVIDAHMHIPYLCNGMSVSKDDSRLINMEELFGKGGKPPRFDIHEDPIKPRPPIRLSPDPIKRKE